MDSGDDWHHNVNIPHAPVHVKIVQMVVFMLCIFYHHKKEFLKITSHDLKSVQTNCNFVFKFHSATWSYTDPPNTC